MDAWRNLSLPLKFLAVIGSFVLTCIVGSCGVTVLALAFAPDPPPQPSLRAEYERAVREGPRQMQPMPSPVPPPSPSMPQPVAVPTDADAGPLVVMVALGERADAGTPSDVPHSFQAMTPAEHLDAARAALAEGYESFRRIGGLLQEAEHHLDALPQRSRDVRLLRREIAGRRQRIEVDCVLAFERTSAHDRAEARDRWFARLNSTRYYPYGDREASYSLSSDGSTFTMTSPGCVRPGERVSGLGYPVYYGLGELICREPATGISHVFEVCPDAGRVRTGSAPSQQVVAVPLR